MGKQFIERIYSDRPVQITFIAKNAAGRNQGEPGFVVINFFRFRFIIRFPRRVIRFGKKPCKRLQFASK
jgi:hypothetical protein